MKSYYVYIHIYIYTHTHMHNKCITCMFDKHTHTPFMRNTVHIHIAVPDSVLGYFSAHTIVAAVDLKYMCVCMYVYMHACMCASCMHVRICVCMCVCTYECIAQSNIPLNTQNTTQKHTHPLQSRAFQGRKIRGQSLKTFVV